ncbi:MAG: hypothetical protein LBT10_02980 [Methanobrevibacter sp.]|nr:hypothetical protein [Methanobrevibacter sp.]
MRLIQKKERGNSSLSQVDNDFYEKVRKFINDLKESITDDPFSEENHVRKKSIAIITEIYEKREQKISNTAIMNIHRSYHLFSGKPQFDFLDMTPLNLTSEEEKLYFSIIETLKVHRERISTDLINENIEFKNLKPQNTEFDNSHEHNLKTSTILDTNSPETFNNNSNNKRNKISAKFDEIKKAKIIEDEKKESINSQVHKSKISHKIKSTTNNDNVSIEDDNSINKDTNDESQKQSLNSDDLKPKSSNINYKENYISSNEIKNKKSKSINQNNNSISDNKPNKDFNKENNLITNNKLNVNESGSLKDNNNSNHTKKDISNDNNFNENGQFIVFEDEERYFNNSKTHEKLNINDKVLSKPILFFDKIPSFVGVDSNVYGPFHPQDVATIPTINAEIIVKNKKGRLLKFRV